MKIFAKIRFYWGAFTISTIVAVIMIPLMMILPKFKGDILHYFNRAILFFMNARVKVYGKRDNSVDLCLINHQGIMDIVALEASENIHLRWVAKKELFDATWFGNVLRYGDMIEVDRDSKAGLIKLIKDVKDTIENKDRVVAIFPEGTRAKGQALLQFKAGTQIVANKLKLKVQPIVIVGSKYVLNEHIKTGHSGTIEVHYLESIDVVNSSKEWYKNIYSTMQEYIDKIEKDKSIYR